MSVSMLQRNPDEDPLIIALRDAVETRNTKFKESQPFVLLQWKSVKACMAIANLRDGGKILIGCDDRSGVPIPSGMSDQDVLLYKQDDVMDWLTYMLGRRCL